jgi:hypothetical protein
MIRRAIVILSAAAIYLMVKRSQRKAATLVQDRNAEAEWANEGGANSPSSV